MAPGFVELPQLADVRFRPGLVTVGPADATVLDAVVRWLKENPGAQVMIEGHTDDHGSRSDNLAVGQKRAASVMNYLVAKGLRAGARLDRRYGADRPVCAEKTDVVPRQEPARPLPRQDGPDGRGRRGRA